MARSGRTSQLETRAGRNLPEAGARPYNSETSLRPEPFRFTGARAAALPAGRRKKALVRAPAPPGKALARTSARPRITPARPKARRAGPGQPAGRGTIYSREQDGFRGARRRRLFGGWRASAPTPGAMKRHGHEKQSKRQNRIFSWSCAGRPWGYAARAGGRADERAQTRRRTFARELHRMSA